MRRWPAACTALIVLALAGAALTLAHRQPRQPLPARTAIADALHSAQVSKVLAARRWTSAQASALDGQYERVSFYDGSRMIVDVLERGDGTVADLGDFTGSQVPYGDWIAYQPSVLVCLSVLFAVMLGVLPLRRLRNLDVLAAISLLAPVVLLQERYISASAISAAPGILWLSARCAWLALGPRRPISHSTPLVERLTRGWEPSQRVRVLRLVLLCLALVYVMVGLSSPSADDVAYAVMEGATRLIHGILPYGHMPGDVFRGDTYPILSYALYTPLALASPVYDVFSSVDLALAAAVAAALLCAWLVGRGGARPPRSDGAEASGGELGGLRAAIGLLAFAPLLITASTGTTDAMLGVMLLLALLSWRRPGASAALIAAGAWFKLAPIALVPIWLAPRRGGALLRALGGLGIVSLSCVGLLVALGGVGGVAAMAHAIGYQFDRESPQSFWYALQLTWMQPLGQAAVLALIAGAAMRLARAPELAGERARLAALAAAVMLGLQFSSSQWAFMYLAWAMPLIGLSLFESAPREARLALPALEPPAQPLLARA